MDEANVVNLEASGDEVRNILPVETCFRVMQRYENINQQGDPEYVKAVRDAAIAAAKALQVLLSFVITITRDNKQEADNGKA